MSVKLKITVTKEILRKSAYCSSAIVDRLSNCAVALAVKDIFPEAQVYQSGMMFFNDFIPEDKSQLDVVFPGHVFWYIRDFDNSSPAERKQMKELSFEIEIPDAVIDQININELKPLFQNHPTLELIEA